MALSDRTKSIVEIALADRRAAAELSAAVDGSASGLAETQADVAALEAAQGSHRLAALIVATNVSQTTDFAALEVGDLVVMIPATAGNSDFIGPIGTAGNLGQAAVVGNLYQVFRAN